MNRNRKEERRTVWNVEKYTTTRRRLCQFFECNDARFDADDDDWSRYSGHSTGNDSDGCFAELRPASEFNFHSNTWSNDADGQNIAAVLNCAIMPCTKGAVSNDDLFDRMLDAEFPVARSSPTAHARKVRALSSQLVSLTTANQKPRREKNK